MRPIGAEQPALQREPVELAERQADEDSQTLIDHPVGVGEGERDLGI